MRLTFPTVQPIVLMMLFFCHSLRGDPFFPQITSITLSNGQTVTLVPNLMSSDPREVLGLPPPGTVPSSLEDDLIKRARAKLSTQFHPDMPGGNLEAQKRVNGAFDKLVDSRRFSGPLGLPPRMVIVIL